MTLAVPLHLDALPKPSGTLNGLVFLPSYRGIMSYWVIKKCSVEKNISYDSMNELGATFKGES